VLLPEDRFMIIDSKAPLACYERLIAAREDEDRPQLPPAADIALASASAALCHERMGAAVVKCVQRVVEFYSISAGLSMKRFSIVIAPLRRYVARSNCPSGSRSLSHRDIDGNPKRSVCFQFNGQAGAGTLTAETSRVGDNATAKNGS
jgi:hypothetical protein